jgi:hypothetical protein
LPPVSCVPTISMRSRATMELNAEIAAAGFRPISDEQADGSLTWVAAVRP